MYTPSSKRRPTSWRTKTDHPYQLPPRGAKEVAKMSLWTCRATSPQQSKYVLLYGCKIFSSPPPSSTPLFLHHSQFLSFQIHVVLLLPHTRIPPFLFTNSWFTQSSSPIKYFFLFSSFFFSSRLYPPLLSFTQFPCPWPHARPLLSPLHTHSPAIHKATLFRIHYRYTGLLAQNELLRISLLCPRRPGKVYSS